MRRLLGLAMGISIALSLAVKAEDAASQDILGPVSAADEIKQCQETLNHLTYLIKWAVLLTFVTDQKLDNAREANPVDPRIPDLKEDVIAAHQNLSDLYEWKNRIQTRLEDAEAAYNKSLGRIPGKKNPQDVSRDAVKDAGADARQAATDAARQTGAEAARSSMDHCPPRGGCH